MRSKPRSLFDFCLLASGMALPLMAFAADEKIPDLLPPRGELAPTFWEQQSWTVILGSAIGLLLIAELIWVLTRPKPVVIEPAATLARRALETLRGRAEDGAA